MEQVYFSQYYNIQADEESDDWFDPRMDLDTNLCIDPFQLFDSDHPFFTNIEQKFVEFFQTACLFAADESNYKLLTTHSLAAGEVRELCLGFSKKGIGKGRKDTDFAKKVTSALTKIVKGKEVDTRLLKAVEIFTPGIGGDKISDITANIIKQELVHYTQSVCEKYPQIETGCFAIEHFAFDVEAGRWNPKFFHLPKNPCFRNTAVILVPRKFLRTIQSISSQEIGTYFLGRPNEELRAMLNNFIVQSTKKNDKAFEKLKDKLRIGHKSTILNIVDRYPGLVIDFLDYVESNKDKFTAYDFEKDPECIYTVPRKIYEFVCDNKLSLQASNDEEFIGCIKKLVQHFIQYVNDGGGYGLFSLDSEPNSSKKIRYRDEHTAQNIFKLFFSLYLDENNIHFDKGRNESSLVCKSPVGLVFPSSYRGKVLIKLKLYRNVEIEDDLSDLLDVMNESSIKLCYYIIIPYLDSEFGKLGKEIEKIRSFDAKWDKVEHDIINVSQNREAFSILEKSRKLEEQKVCISYARSGFSGKVTDKLCRILDGEKVKYVRDTELKYKNNMSSFMTRIGQGKCIVAVISDDYLKSDYCMEEILQAVKKGGLKGRIVPLVMNDAIKMYDPIESLDYVEYWRDRAKKLEDTIKDKNLSLANTKGSRHHVDLFADIERNVSEILEFLRDIFVDPINIESDSDLESLNFTDVVAEIQKIVREG